jgi:alanine-alpha-ketoisovalerate/valine-pyruvate aminotransferase
MNGGKPVYVPLRPPTDAADRVISSHEWTLDIEELKSKVTSKTKMIVLNTPHNPIGKVFDENELRAIGQVAEENNLIILSDEVVSIRNQCSAWGIPKLLFVLFSTIVFTIHLFKNSLKSPISTIYGSAPSLLVLVENPLPPLVGV